MTDDQTALPTHTTGPQPDVLLQAPPSGSKIDIEISKLHIEAQRLRIDRDKADFDKKNSRIMVWVAVFTAIFGGGALTAVTAYQNAERLKFDIETQRKKDDLLLSKKSEAGQAKDAARVQFLRENIELVMSQDPDAERKLTVLAKVVLSNDADIVLAQARTIRADLKGKEVAASNDKSLSERTEDSPANESAPPLVIRYSNASPPESKTSVNEYISKGKRFVDASDFEQALVNFDMAVSHDPNDPLVWNFKAYSEFRTNRIDSALNSIIQAVKLHPTDNKTRRWIAINATKILCAQKRADEAATYFNQNASIVPEIVADVQGDGEFQKTCKSIWRG